MTRRDAATERQVQAADPSGSVWLSANAGSGKTRVLTDRVARLLLNGVSPQHILCLTYTKAAASEMQNRLFQRLGSWAMLGDEAITDGLRGLGVDGQIDNKKRGRGATPVRPRHRNAGWVEDSDDPFVLRIAFAAVSVGSGRFSAIQGNGRPRGGAFARRDHRGHGRWRAYRHHRRPCRAIFG